MQQARSEAELYRIYVEQRALFGTGPSFYFEVAALLFTKGMREFAFQVSHFVAV